MDRDERERAVGGTCHGSQLERMHVKRRARPPADVSIINIANRHRGVLVRSRRQIGGWPRCLRRRQTDTPRPRPQLVRVLEVHRITTPNHARRRTAVERSVCTTLMDRQAGEETLSRMKLSPQVVSAWALAEFYTGDGSRTELEQNRTQTLRVLSHL